MISSAPEPALPATGHEMRRQHITPGRGLKRGAVCHDACARKPWPTSASTSATRWDPPPSAAVLGAEGRGRNGHLEPREWRFADSLRQHELREIDLHALDSGDLRRAVTSVEPPGQARCAQGHRGLERHLARTVELEVSILSTFETGASTRRISKKLSVAPRSDINPQSGAFPRGANRRLPEQSLAAHGKRRRSDRFL